MNTLTTEQGRLKPFERSSTPLCAAERLGAVAEASPGLRRHPEEAALPRRPGTAFSSLLERAQLRRGGCSLLKPASAPLSSRFWVRVRVGGGPSRRARERVGWFSARWLRARRGGRKGLRGGSFTGANGRPVQPLTPPPALNFPPAARPRCLFAAAVSRRRGRQRRRAAAASLRPLPGRY